eukprot:3149554-Lingulodinium_polyedra.AAC.1
MNNTGAMQQALEGLGFLDSVHKHPQQKVMVRYWLASQKAFEKVTSCSVSLDAGQVSNKKWMFLVLQARVGEGECKACWMPPQVPNLAC